LQQAIRVDAPPGESAVRRFLRNNAPILAVWGIFLVMVLAAAIYSPNFRSTGNLFNAFRQSIFLGMLAIGQTIVIIAGGIDLSVGSILKLTVLIAAGFMAGQIGLTIPVILLCLGIGAFIGLMNGVIVTKLGVAPFIATLGMYTIVRGMAYGYTTKPIGKVTKPLRDFYNAQIGPVPLPLILFIVVLIIAIFVMSRTAYGRHLYAVGGNEVVARLSGLKVNWLKVSVFMISGFMAAAAGILMVSRMGIGDPAVGENMELDSIAAVVLGGTSLAGGRGAIIGTVGGVLILAFVNNIFNLLAISTWYQGLIKGAIILLAVALYKQKH
jgi:ribose transport system permease protein